MTNLPYPAPLQQLSEIDLWPEDAEDAIDLEVYDEWLDDEETLDWWRAWTGNDDLASAPFHIFGQDGTGGFVGFFDRSGGTPLTECPIVFLGSEGAKGVVAADLNDFLGLLAQGTGPFEAVELDGFSLPPLPELQELQQEFCSAEPASVEALLQRAQDAVPDFSEYVESLIR